MRWLFLLSLFVLIWDEGLAVEPKVLKETPFDFERDEKGKLVVKKRRYVDYRPLWGKRVTLISAEHAPVPVLFDQDRIPIQLEISFVRNLKIFSIGAEAGFMSLEWNNFDNVPNETDRVTIDMTNYYFGLVMHLDSLFSWPYVVPFVSVGAISINADRDPPDNDGGTVVADGGLTLYYRAGFLFSLNWIDRMMSIRAYDDFGLLNSYVYIGVRQWSETDSNPNLNLEIDPSLEFGLQLEF